MATATRKRATAADIVAAVKVGAIAPDAEVMTTADMAEELDGIAQSAEVAILSSAEHGCGIPGCRHGAAHPVQSQPDRQVKLSCPICGAVARMTAAAIARTSGNGIVCGLDGVTFGAAARRTYTRRAQS